MAAAVYVNPVTHQPFQQVAAPGGATTTCPVNAQAQCGTTAGAVTVRVPAPTVEGILFSVQDSDGNAAANNITVDGNGVLIDGAATVVLSSANAYATFIFDQGQYRRLSPVRLAAATARALYFTVDAPPVVANPNFGASDITTTGSLLVGPTPRASTGVIRLANGQVIRIRNAANSADVAALSLDGADVLQLSPNVGISTALQLGAGTRSTTGELRLANLATIKARNAGNSADVTLMSLDGANVLQLAPDVQFATTLRMGAVPALSGGVRLPNGVIFNGRNAANSGDVGVLVLDSSNNVIVGASDSGGTNGSGQTFVASANFIYHQIGGANICLWSSSGLQTGVPQFGNSTPYAATDGHLAAAMGNADRAVTAGEQSNKSLQLTGAITAARTLTWPAPTLGAYFKWIQNSTTGGFNVVVTTGSGTTQALGAGGTPHLYRFSSTGVDLMV